MSPILDLQARLREAGRIRIGTSKPRDSGRGRQPVRLGTFRLTSKDESLIRAVADLYGGEPQPWELKSGEWEVVTEADELRVVLIPVPGGSISQWYERWEQPTVNGKPGAVSCVRRCDGVEQANGEPCRCPADPEQRSKDDQACSMYTRLSVLLPDVPTMGCWRLETQGYYAGVELAAAVALVDNALASSGLMVAARLRLEQRKVARDGNTLTFPVPALDLVDRLDRVASLAAGAARGEIVGAAPLALPAAGTLERQAVDVAAGLAAAEAQAGQERRQGRQSAPLGPAAVAPSTSAIDSAGEPGPTAMIDEAKRRMLHARKKELGLTDDEVKDAIEELTGQRSTTAVPRARLDDLLTVMAAKAQSKAAATDEEQSLFKAPAGATSGGDET